MAIVLALYLTAMVTTYESFTCRAVSADNHREAEITAALYRTRVPLICSAGPVDKKDFWRTGVNRGQVSVFCESGDDIIGHLSFSRDRYNPFLIEVSNLLVNSDSKDIAVLVTRHFEELLLKLAAHQEWDSIWYHDLTSAANRFLGAVSVATLPLRPGHPFLLEPDVPRSSALCFRPLVSLSGKDWSHFPKELQDLLGATESKLFSIDGQSHRETKSALTSCGQRSARTIFPSRLSELDQRKLINSAKDSSDSVYSSSVWLALDDLGTPSLCSKLLNAGFEFGGYVPKIHGGDHLVLVHWQAVETVQPISKKLLASQYQKALAF